MRKVNVRWCLSQLFGEINGDIQRLHTLYIKVIECRLRYAELELPFSFSLVSP